MIIVLIVFVITLLYCIREYSFYDQLRYVDFDTLITKYQEKPKLDEDTKIVVVIFSDDLLDDRLKMCIKSIFNQSHRVDNLYVVNTNSKYHIDLGNIPDYIQNTCVLVSTLDEVKLLEPENSTRIIVLPDKIYEKTKLKQIVI